MLGEVGQDHARLRVFAVAAHQHRHFAHFVDAAAEFRRTLLELDEEIEKDRLPVGPDQIEHERRAIGIARLRETVELVFGHTCIPS
jgi:hypothetical protein